MKNEHKFNNRRIYCQPTITLVELDNEISLALESPPIFPGEDLVGTMDLIVADPFQNTLF